MDLKAMEQFANIFMINISDFDFVNKFGSSNFTRNPRVSDWNERRKTVSFAIMTILAIVGLAGNLLCCIVIKRFLLRLSGTYILFLFLSITDSLVIIMFTIDAYLNSIGQHTIMASWSCKCFKFFWFFALQLSAWIVMALTIDRYLTLRYFYITPDRQIVLRRAWIMGGLLVALAALVNGHMFFTVHLEDISFYKTGSRSLKCVYSTPDKITTARIVNTIHIILYGAIPYSVTLVFNFLLIHHLRSCRHASPNRTTFMLLLVTFAFILLTSPYLIHSVMVQENIGLPPITSTYNIQSQIIVQETVRYLLFLNNSLNFALYLSGRQFRDAVKCLFCKLGFYRRYSYSARNGNPPSLMTKDTPPDLRQV